MVIKRLYNCQAQARGPMGGYHDQVLEGWPGVARASAWPHGSHVTLPRGARAQERGLKPVFNYNIVRKVGFVTTFEFLM
jgi:hypothetical protein